MRLRGVTVLRQESTPQSQPPAPTHAQTFWQQDELVLAIEANTGSRVVTIYWHNGDFPMGVPFERVVEWYTEPLTGPEMHRLVQTR